MTTLTIPYESLDPLTIGASGDETKVSRETLELEVADANLLTAVYPEEPDPVADATEAARAALEAPVSGPPFSEILAGGSKVAVVIDNQFRPTPQSRLLPAVLDAIEAAGKPAVVVCANGKVFPMSDSDIEQKLGRENLERMERLGISFSTRTTRATWTATRTSAYRRAVRPCGCTTKWLRATSRSRSARPSRITGAPVAAASSSCRASSRTRPSSRITAPSYRRRRRTTAPTPGPCARTSTRWQRCAGSAAR